MLRAIRRHPTANRMHYRIWKENLELKPTMSVDPKPVPFELTTEESIAWVRNAKKCHNDFQRHNPGNYETSSPKIDKCFKEVHDDGDRSPNKIPSE